MSKILSVHNPLWLPSHIRPHTHAHTCKHPLMRTWKTSTPTSMLLKALNGTERLAQWFTSKGPLIETLFDAVGSAHMEGLGDLLVHEALPVENIGHHHPQVKHLEQLCDGCHLHQVASALVQAACVQVLKHRLRTEQSEVKGQI